MAARIHNRQALNNYLQEVCKNTRQLTWEISREGPDHWPTWLAIANLDGVEWGRGQGTRSSGAAMEAAAKRVLNALGVVRQTVKNSFHQRCQGTNPRLLYGVACFAIVIKNQEKHSGCATR
ncbi:hypothetical protein BU15DRAFT_66667 [Melanogaster broomeanus]|nr:hypothetical protein BU15DRAFT_66667 [Melanogaster broomeanus]